MTHDKESEVISLRHASDGVLKFRKLLKLYPRFNGLWDFHKSRVNLEQAEQALTVHSHGECIMLRFFLAVWLGENRHNFDIIDAVRVLDLEDLDRITDWMKSPFWP